MMQSGGTPVLQYAHGLAWQLSAMIERCDVEAQGGGAGYPSALDPAYFLSSRDQYDAALSAFAVRLYAGDWSSAMLDAARRTLVAAVAAGMPRSIVLECRERCLLVGRRLQSAYQLGKQEAVGARVAAGVERFRGMAPRERHAFKRQINLLGRLTEVERKPCPPRRKARSARRPARGRARRLATRRAQADSGGDGDGDGSGGSDDAGPRRRRVICSGYGVAERRGLELDTASVTSNHLFEAVSHG